MKKILIIAGLCLGYCQCPAAPILIGHVECSAVTNAPRSVLDRVARMKWFFAHASVGGDLMNGLSDWNNTSAALYPLRNQTLGEPAAPATTEGGFIYDIMRGNPGWKAKVDMFADYVTNGWRFPLVDMVINKFCYVDPDADVNYYINSMSTLEAAFPNTRFVYATIPLTTEESFDNYRRNVFNDSLRVWVRANSRVLFDIADIESHDPTGAEQTFVYDNQVCQKLYSGYTGDGGHLTYLAGRDQGALGFYALGIAIVAEQDAIRPLNLKIQLTQQEMLIRFTATSDTNYRVQFSPSIESGSWQDLTNIAAQPYMGDIELREPLVSSNRYYRVIRSLVP